MFKTKYSIVRIFLLLVLMLGAYIYWSPARTKIQDQGNTEVPSTPIPTVDPIGSWKTLLNGEVTLKYPSEAKAEARSNESLVFFMGQKQINSGRTQTELFDGYTLRVERIASQSGASLSQLAEQERANAQTNCQSETGQVSPLRPVTVGGNSGFEFSATDCYIDYTETIVSAKAINYRISRSYVGDKEDQEKYKEITRQIFSTIIFAD